MRERWFGATGRRVPEIALEGELDLEGALVLDGVDGKFTAQLRTDAKRAGQMPSGGVDTGAGGTAQADYTPLWVGGSVLVALIAAAVLVRRRWRTA